MTESLDDFDPFTPSTWIRRPNTHLVGGLPIIVSPYVAVGQVIILPEGGRDTIAVHELDWIAMKTGKDIDRRIRLVDEYLQRQIAKRAKAAEARLDKFVDDLNTLAPKNYQTIAEFEAMEASYTSLRRAIQLSKQMYRTPEEQQRLYAEYVTDRFNEAYPRYRRFLDTLMPKDRSWWSGWTRNRR